MYLTLRIFFLSNPAITAKLPNFAEFMELLDAAILQIQSNSEEQQYDTKGVASNKQEYRNVLIDLTVDGSNKMQAYAKYVRNTILVAETKFTKTALVHASALELVDIAKGLKSRIDSHLADVIPYGLTEASQAEYQAAISAFEELIPHTRQSQLKSKENSLLEAQGFSTADEAVSSIDTVVEILRMSDPVFYAGYRNARRIVDQGTNTIQVQGVVTEAANQKPIPYALVSFKLSGQPEIVMQKETAAKGGFMIKSLPEAVYDISVSKVGFQDKTVTTTVRWDELCNVEVALDKL